MNKIKSKKWDVVVLQEQSQLPAFGEHQVCAESVTPLLSLMDAIRSNSQDTVAQVYINSFDIISASYSFNKHILPSYFFVFFCS